jgi:LysM repeat protein
LGTEFLVTMQSAKAKLEAGRLAEAHVDLSKYYTTTRLNPEEWRLAVDLLDQLAGTVIYSREHLLEPAYRVQPGDTLERIAMVYNVPCELLAKINGVRDTRQLVPGQEIKVLRGPFEAVVDLTRCEMTLLLGGRYAGRFTIGVGRDRANLEGAFVVRDKKSNPIYFGPDRVIAADDPTNPLGERLLDLGNQMGIHGTDSPKNIGTSDGRGTIRLSQRDVEDVYDILSIGSPVTVRR